MATAKATTSDTVVHPAAAAATKIFQASPYQQIRQLQCSFVDGTLTIAGRVSTYYLKQQAQIAVQHLDGVQRIRNVIEVSAC